MRRRLDLEMVRRGMSASPSEAAVTIRSGRVVVGGRPAVKASTLIMPGDPIAVSPTARRYVSRGGEKLEAALDRFEVDVSGRRALDAGSSTGGFTHCLLSRGAVHVIAVDVGYGQLDWRLREDPRVTVRERTNVRSLDPSALPYRPDVITADLSFVSLRLALPSLARCASADAQFLLLLKPQFEAERHEVMAGGVVSDPVVWKRVVEQAAVASRGVGIAPIDVMVSPLLGPAGNAEFLLLAGGADHERTAELDEASIERAVGEAGAMTRGG